MLISEKAVRIFARSILFENSESVDLNEMSLAPDDTMDRYKIQAPGLTSGQPLETIDWQSKIKNKKETQVKDDNLIDVNDISSLAPHESIPPDLEDEGCRNPGDFKVKVSLELDKVGLNAENEDLDDALNKITKVIRGML